MTLFTRSTFVALFTCLFCFQHTYGQDSTFQLNGLWQDLKIQLIRYNDIALNLTAGVSDSKLADKNLIIATKKHISEVTTILMNMDTADISVVQYIKPRYDSIFQSISVYKQVIEKDAKLRKSTLISGLVLQSESSLNRINSLLYDFNKLCWAINRRELIWEFYVKAVEVRF